MLNAVRCRDPDAVSQKPLLDEAARFAADWEDLDAEHLRPLLLAVVTQVQVHSDRIDVTLDQVGIALWLDVKADQPTKGWVSFYDFAHFFRVASAAVSAMQAQ